MQTTGSSSCVAMVMLACLVAEVAGLSIKIRYNSDVTCYTCPGMKDKQECNSWAPDVPCPLANSVCKTVHLFDRQTGESVRVDKLCALSADCSLDTVGCTDTDDDQDHIECVSCCSESYCNVDVPHNLTTSLQLSVSVFASAARATHVSLTSLLTSLAAVAALLVLR